MSILKRRGTNSGEIREYSEATGRKMYKDRGEKKKAVQKRFTSAGLKVSTPSLRPCFKLLLFCLID